MSATNASALALCAALLVAGCASSGPASNSNASSASVSDHSASPPPARERHRVTFEEVRSRSDATSAYDLVQILRPMWLQKRGRSSILFEGDIAVFVDGGEWGGVSELRHITAGDIVSMEFIDPGSAQNRYGLGYPHGIIMLHTR